MKNNSTPMWLRIQAAIDYQLFVAGRLKNELNSTKPKSVIDSMIDTASGYDNRLKWDVEYCIRYIRRLKKLWAIYGDGSNYE